VVGPLLGCGAASERPFSAKVVALNGQTHHAPAQGRESMKILVRCAEEERMTVGGTYASHRFVLSHPEGRGRVVNATRAWSRGREGHAGRGVRVGVAARACAYQVAPDRLARNTADHECEVHT